MARLPALVDALAEHDPRGHPSIAHIARRVREGKLITSETRGAGAATMTYRDAATLLMASCGDINPLGAVEAAKRLHELEPVPADSMRVMQREDLPDHFEWLRKPTGFARTLELLIKHAPQLAEWEQGYQASWADDMTKPTEAEFSIKRAIDRFASSTGGFRPGLSKPIRVIFYVPGVAAEIHLGWVWNDVLEADAFHEYYAPPKARTKSDPSEKSLAPDVLIPVEIGVRTLVALHQAVNAKPKTRGPAKRPRMSEGHDASERTQTGQ